MIEQQTAVSPTPLPSIIHPPRWQTPLLRLRERSINALLRVDPHFVLNPATIEPASQTSTDVATNLLTALQKLQGSVISNDGVHVNYAKLREHPTYHALRRDFLPTLHALSPMNFSTVSEARAFWINLYNMLVIDAVIQLNVQKSVTEGRIGILTFFRRAAYIIGGQRLSLEEIEHGILRGNQGHPYFPGPQFAADDPRLSWVLPLDPRIHFALNCASHSCPPISFFDTHKLDEQFETAAKSFINASTTIQPEENKLIISQIFNWYKGDFGHRNGLIKLLLRYLPDDERRRFAQNNATSLKLTFAGYDWRLND